MRSEVSVPGIRNDRGKLPVVTGALRWTGLRPKPRHVGPRRRSRRRRLRELIDPFLEELLIGPQIRQFIGAHRRKASQQHNRDAQPADRRHAADIPLPGHRRPP